MTPPTHVLRLSALLLSPAALLALGAWLLEDATRAPWPGVALAGGAVFVALLLANPGRLPIPGGVVELTSARWVDAGPSLVPLSLAQGVTAFLFVWAQLAAVRELAEMTDLWPPAVVVLVAVGLVMAASTDLSRELLVDAGAVVALAGLVVPVLAILLVTTPAWPRVWATVAARPRLTFPEGGAWTGEGAPVRARGATDVVLTFTEEQRVTVLAPGSGHLDSREGSRGRDVPADTELLLRPGDRLVVAPGTRVRFEPGRRIPGAPASGTDWVSPPESGGDGWSLAGLATTLALGALGIPGIHAGLGAGPRGARVAAGLVVAGAGLALLWGLYAAWLTPEIYVGGVAGVEVYELPGRVAALGPLAGPFRILALGGLAAGGVASALVVLGGVPRHLPGRSGGSRMPLIGAGAIGATVAAFSPVGPWAPLLTAFALAASSLAPAALLTRWSERVTPRSLGAGAAVGLLLFSGLTLAALWLHAGPADAPGPGRLAAALAWPALLALPANALVAWLRVSPPGASPGSPLADRLTELHRADHDATPRR